MTTGERKSANNGIWLCAMHAKAVDANDSEFTVELLRGWKIGAQKDSRRRVLNNEISTVSPALGISKDDLSTRLRSAVAADLEVFRRSDKWPSVTIPRSLRVDGLDEPIDTSRLGTVLTALDDLVLIAEPGMGKTTAVFQIAEAALKHGHASPIVVPLGDWSATDTSLLEAILNRTSFQGISEDEFREVAESPGVLLLLDGWNELDATARKRATAELRRLEMELPNLSLLIATRKQARDVPIDGTPVALQPLSEVEQLEIASALCGEAGIRLLDEAWRTSGVSELITIPLYLTALLALPEGSAIPTTKEEILRRLVMTHESDYLKSAEIQRVTQGLHEKYLTQLGVTATNAANTTILETSARSAISNIATFLVTDGQISIKPEPHAVLESFVNHHVLIRVGVPAGYSFQHQQFQEWYASHTVERVMCESVHNQSAHDTLIIDYLDKRTWEEPVLFACERLARGSEAQQEACAAAILSAFTVDPVFAAEMIYRATNAVWHCIRPTTMDLIDRWHIPGTVDLSVHFMMTSGREEFFQKVWPLITHEDDKINFEALHAGGRFRPSLLGNQAIERIEELPTKVREHVLNSIAYNSGMEGLDLAAAVAKADPVAEVRSSPGPTYCMHGSIARGSITAIRKTRTARKSSSLH